MFEKRMMHRGNWLSRHPTARQFAAHDDHNNAGTKSSAGGHRFAAYYSSDITRSRPNQPTTDKNAPPPNANREPAD